MICVFDFNNLITMEDTTTTAEALTPNLQQKTQVVDPTHQEGLLVDDESESDDSVDGRELMM